MPDGWVQVYPTLVIRGTGLYELWKKGLYHNYEPTLLIDLVARILALVPPWVRVYRIQVMLTTPISIITAEFTLYPTICCSFASHASCSTLKWHAISTPLYSVVALQFVT